MPTPRHIGCACTCAKRWRDSCDRSKRRRRARRRRTNRCAVPCPDSNILMLVRHRRIRGVDRLHFEEELAMEPRRIFHCLALASIVTTIALTSEVRAAFAPTDITGLQLWLDANDVNGDGIANNPSSGTAVSSWIDKSGQVHNASQATAAN